MKGSSLADRVKIMRSYTGPQRDCDRRGGVASRPPSGAASTSPRDLRRGREPAGWPDSVDSLAPAYNRSVSYGDDSSQSNQQLDPKLSMKLNNAVSMLPKSLQETFVERIVENVASPSAFQKHVDAVSVLATAAAIEAQNQTIISNAQADAPHNDGARGTTKLSMSNQSEVTLPIAAATLGAFLAKYGNSSADENKDPSGDPLHHPVKQ